MRHPGALSPQHVLQLQRLAGNRTRVPRLAPSGHPATLTIRRNITEDVNATMTPGADRPADKVMATYSTGASTSGHTTGKDWKNIGNVGDTFYGLFYDDNPASGVAPSFIKAAVYYAQWPATEFGDAWASADRLSYASESQQPDRSFPTSRGWKATSWTSLRRSTRSASGVPATRRNNAPPRLAARQTSR